MLKKYRYTQFLADANLFWGLAGFFIILAEGARLIEPSITNPYIRHPNVLNALSGHILTAILFFIGSCFIGYYLHGLRRIALTTDQAQPIYTDKTASEKTELKIMGYILGVLGVGFTLFLAFLIITRIFNSTVDDDYECDFDCYVYTPPPDIEWVLFTTEVMIATFALWGLTANRICLMVYRFNQVEHLYPDIFRQPSTTMGTIVSQIMGFLAIMGGIGILTLIQLAHIASSIPILASNSGYWLGFILLEGLIWVCGLGLIGVGVAIFNTQKIKLGR